LQIPQNCDLPTWIKYLILARVESAQFASYDGCNASVILILYLLEASAAQSI
jgi:hypothetical protein